MNVFCHLSSAKMDFPLCHFSPSDSELAVGQRTWKAKPAAGSRPITSRAETLGARKACLFLPAGGEAKWVSAWHLHARCHLRVWELRQRLGPLLSLPGDKRGAVKKQFPPAVVGGRRPTELLRQPPSCHRQSFFCLLPSLLTPTHCFCGLSCQLQGCQS